MNHLLIKGPGAYKSLRLPFFTNSLYILSLQYGNVFKNQIKAVLRGIRFGFFAEIRTEGVGFRFARIEGAPQFLVLDLGFGNDLFVNFPNNIKFRCLKYRLLLFGFEFSLLTSWSLRIKSFRFPDLYKGKGLKFAKEILKFKPGKQRQR